MTVSTVGFIGFGEVATVFSRALIQSGVEVVAFDRKQHEESGLKVLKGRVQTDGLQFCTLDALVAGVDVILSTVTSLSALSVAQACAPLMNSHQIFIDLNSISAATKHEIGEIISSSGASFVEGVILGAIRTFGVNARILLTGLKAEEIASLLNASGLKARPFGRVIGRASTFKLLRSVFSKSIEAALLETLIASELAGMRDDIWSELVSTFSEQSFDALATAWITTHPLTHRRRLAEMADVLTLVKQKGLTPRVTEGVFSFFEQSATLSFESLPEQQPWTIVDVIRRMAEQLKEKVQSD